MTKHQVCLRRAKLSRVKFIYSLLVGMWGEKATKTDRKIYKEQRKKKGVEMSRGKNQR